MHRLAIALTTVLGLIAAAYVAGYLFVFGASAHPAASLVPADAAVYVRVYLQPSAGQQANLTELIGRLPGFADDATLDEKVDQVVQNVLSESGFDYRADIKPWLGNQLAAASWFGDDQPATPRRVLIVEVKDRAAADAALLDFAESSGSPATEETHEGTTLHVGESHSWAFVEEMLVVSDTADAVRTVIDTAAGAPDLAGRTDFRASMAQLAQDHLAAAFFDFTATGADVPEGQLQGFSNAALAIVAEREALRMTGSAPRAPDPDSSAEPTLGGEASTLTEWMPGNTVTEVVVFGLDQILADAEAAASETPGGEDLRNALDGVRAMTALGFGIDFDADLLPLLDREAALAITVAPNGEPSALLLLRPSDPETGLATLDRIADRLGGLGGERRDETVEGIEVTVVTVPQFGEVAFAGSEGVILLGLTVDDLRAGIEAHSDGTHLAASQSYRDAFEHAGERAGNEIYADVAALLEVIGIAQTLPADARDILAQIGSFAMAMPSHDDQIEIQAVLTIDEAGAE